MICENLLENLSDIENLFFSCDLNWVCEYMLVLVQSTIPLFYSQLLY